jgi:hypothetical protein
LTFYRQRSALDSAKTRTIFSACLSLHAGTETARRPEQAPRTNSGRKVV